MPFPCPHTFWGWNRGRHPCVRVGGGVLVTKTAMKDTPVTETRVERVERADSAAASAARQPVETVDTKAMPAPPSPAEPAPPVAAPASPVQASTEPPKNRVP